MECSSQQGHSPQALFYVVINYIYNKNACIHYNNLTAYITVMSNEHHAVLGAEFENNLPEG